MAVKSFRIGAWTLQPEAHALSREGHEHRVPKRLVLLLQVLAEHAGQTLSREQLLDQVWQRRVVNDEVLSRAVAELRSLLGDDARSPQYIETLPKTGYRLIAPVTVLGGEPSAAGADSETRIESGQARQTDEPAGVEHPAASQPTPRGKSAIVILLAGVLLAVGAWWTSRSSMPDRGVLTVQQAPAPDWTPERLVREQPFRSGPDWARQPRYSQDGRWLAYVVSEVGAAQTSVVLSTVDGSSSQRIEAGPGRIDSPVFSPDGTRMAVMARVDRACTIRIIDLPAGAPRELVACAGQVGSSLDWPMPDRLLYTGAASPGRGAGIWAVNPETAVADALTDPAAEDIADTMPRARRDGGFAFLRGPFLLQKVWAWQPEGERLLFDSADRVTGMAWTGDGTQLLLSTDRSGFPALHRFDPATGQSQLLGGRGAATMDRGADDSLIYEQRRYDTNVWLYTEGAPPRQVTSSTRYDAYPDLSPDGRRLVYVSNRDGNGSVWVVDLQGGDELRLDLPEALAWVRPSWIDDGHIALTRYDADHGTALFAFDLAAHRLVDHPLSHGAGFSAERAGAHGLLLGYDHGVGDGMQLVLRDLEGGRALPGIRAVGEFRADGDLIAWQQRGRPGILVRDLAATASDERDAPELVVPPHDADSDYFAWTLAGERVVYAHRDETGWALWRRPVRGGEPERWLSLRTAPSDAQLSVSPGFDAAVISHLDAFHADLMRVPPP